MHPRIEVGAHPLQRRIERHVTGAIAGLVRIENQVVELLPHHWPVAPAVREPDILTWAIVDIRQHWAITIVEAADVFPTTCACSALGLVRGVVGYLGEDRLVDLTRFAPNKRHERAPLKPAWPFDLQQPADRWEQVDVRDERVADLAATEAARAAQNQRDANAMVGQSAFHAWEGRAVVV